MSRTIPIEASNNEHKDVIEFILNNKLDDHAVIISNGKVLTTKLPSHGRVNIVTEDGKVTKVQEYNSELF